MSLPGWVEKSLPPPQPAPKTGPLVGALVLRKPPTLNGPGQGGEGRKDDCGALREGGAHRALPTEGLMVQSRAS